MSKKEHQIWQQINYDDYLIEGHIFSFEKQLKFQGKIVLNYVIYDSDEANKTYDDLFNQKKSIKKPQININPYNNENHPIWECRYTYEDNYMESLYGEICLVQEDGKYIQPYEDYEKLKYWD
jgi:hypothetical protein